MGFVRGPLALLAGALVATAVVLLTLGPGLPGVAAQSGSTVAIVDFAFEPALTGVAIGDTVTWTNSGAEAHTVTADNSDFNSGNLAPGERFSQTFAGTGSFTYRCRIHPSMTGTVVVAGVGKGESDGTDPEAVPVVGVGTMAPGRSGAGAVSLMAGALAVILGSAAVALRRA